MIRRLIILQIVLLCGLSSIWLLPHTPASQNAALVDPLILPERLSMTGWQSPGAMSTEGSTEEKARLAEDTEFRRRDYRREVSFTEQPVEPGEPVLLDELNTSIVLSGKDLSGSIHALERCLTAQGFNIPSASTMRIKLRSGDTLPVRRLVCERMDMERKKLQRSIAYYWFVGHDSVTSNHVKRGLKDFWDRIARGYDQRWAYITVTANLDGSYLYEPLPPKSDKKTAEAGKEETKPEEAKPKQAVLRDPATGRPLARRPLKPEESDKIVEEFIWELGPDIIKVDQVKEWPEE